MVRRKTCIEHNPSSPIRMNHSRHIYIFRMGEHVRVLCIFIQSFVLHGTVFRIQLPNILSHITDSWNLVCFCFIFSSSSTTTFGKHVLVTIFLRQLHMVTKFNLKCEKKNTFQMFPLIPSPNIIKRKHFWTSASHSRAALAVCSFLDKPTISVFRARGVWLRALTIPPLLKPPVTSFTPAISVGAHRTLFIPDGYARHAMNHAVFVSLLSYCCLKRTSTPRIRDRAQWQNAGYQGGACDNKRSRAAAIPMRQGRH